MNSENRNSMYSDIKKSAELYSHHTAYMFMGKKTSYKTFVNEIDTAANALVEMGIGMGDVVCVAMPNMPQALILVYAINKIGAIANMIHPLSSAKEIVDFVNRFNAKIILIMDQFYQKIKHIRHETKIEQVIVASAGEVLSPLKRIAYILTEGRKIKVDQTEGIIFWPAFFQKGKESGHVSTCPDGEKTALIMHSGGTTGKSKGVCLSNNNVHHFAKKLSEATPILNHTDRFLAVMPIFHGYGLGGIHTGFVRGVATILLPRFTPKTYVKALLQYRCSFLSGVPALYEKLLEIESLKKADLSFLRCAFCGGDYLSGDLENRLNDFFRAHGSPVVIRQGYGMTEGVATITVNPVEKRKHESVGIPMPGIHLKIVEPGTETELPFGETGEIVFSSETNMQGYYHDPEETALVLKKHGDGLTWVHTGDLGFTDEDGYLFFKGRVKRMIVVNGYNVFPNELENIIESFDMVDRCVIAGIPAGEGSHKIKAFVVLRPGFFPSDEMRQIIREESKKYIAKYAIPKEIAFLDEMPTTKIGKVDVKALLATDPC